MGSQARGDVIQGTGQRQRNLLLPRTRFVAPVLLLLAVLAYVNTLFHPFVYDDLGLVLKNPSIRSLSNIPALLGLGHGGMGLRARWTRDVAYALEYAIAGPAPPLYHLTNMLLHGLVGILVFLLIRRIAASPLLGWWVSAFFVLHPIGTDVVAPISGRREILATLFSLITILALVPRSAGTSWIRLAGALVALYLGVFSKEMAIMAPCLVPLVDLFAAPRTGSGWVREVLRKRWRVYAVLAAGTVGLAAMRLLLSEQGADLHGSPGFYETQLGGLSVLDRLRLFGLGIRLLVFPWGLSPDYSYDALDLASRSLSVAEIVDLSVFAVALVGTLRGIRTRSWAGLGGIWFFLFSLPTSGILPWHEIFAERFFYLPSIGFHLAVASALVALSRKRRRFAMGLGLGVLVLLAAATIARNRVWTSPGKLWEDAVARYPDCARAHKALGDQYLATRRPQDALAQYRAAVQILPPYRDARIGVGAALAASGRADEAEGVYNEVLKDWPEEPKALNDLGLLLEKRGDDEGAFRLYERATRSGPEVAEPCNNLGTMYAKKGDLDSAIRLYEAALARDPSLLEAIHNLATVYRYGRRDEATAQTYDERARQLLHSR